MKKTIKLLREFERKTNIEKDELFFRNMLVEIKENILVSKNLRQGMIAKRFSYAFFSTFVVIIPLFIILLGGKPSQNKAAIAAAPSAQEIKISIPEAQTLYAVNHHLVSLARTGSEDAKTELFFAVKSTISPYEDVSENRVEPDIASETILKDKPVLITTKKLSKDQLNSKALIYTEFLVEGLSDFLYLENNE